jgi:hypothetical protein
LEGYKEYGTISMAKMNQYIIVEDDVLLFNGSVPSVDTILYIRYEGRTFPNEQWTDYAYTVLSMWTDSLLRNLSNRKAKFELPFFDGPYRLDAEKIGEQLTLKAVNFKKHDFVVFTMNLGYNCFIKEVRNAVSVLKSIVCKAWREDKPNKEVCKQIIKDCQFLIRQLDNAITGTGYCVSSSIRCFPRKRVDPPNGRGKHS